MKIRRGNNLNVHQDGTSYINYVIGTHPLPPFGYRLCFEIQSFLILQRSYTIYTVYYVTPSTESRKLSLKKKIKISAAKTYEQSHKAG